MCIIVLLLKPTNKTAQNVDRVLLNFNSSVFSEQNADEAEWEAFQKEIAVEVAASADLTATDQMEETVGRQLEEIDDQMRAWTRVRNIEIRKDDVETRLRDKKSGAAADTSHVKTEMSDEEVSVSDIHSP